ncbi:MAG: hypothetical protein QOF58_7325, partial [Pseudonocardiales bacterium]|nr:hypothetical protein [Pseudonocardiales bacterium]
MMFTLSEEQTDFASVLHGFLAAGKRGLAELGVDEVTDPVDLVVVFEELGHHAVPGPLIESLAVVPALAGMVPELLGEVVPGRAISAQP